MRMTKVLVFFLVCLSLLEVKGYQEYQEYRITPFGLVHKDCIIEVPSGTYIEPRYIYGVEHVHILHPNGTAELHSRCPHATPREKRAPPPTWNGWPEHYWYGLDFAYFTNPALTSPVISFDATWNVPNYPANRNGNSASPWPNQPTLSWWPGIQPSGISLVLQPVLEFNGLIANAYDLSSWNCCPAGYTFHSSPLAVSPGQTASGTMDIVSPNDPYTFRIVSQVVGGASTSLVANLSSDKPKYTWTEVKNEGYYVTNCNQLPSNGATFTLNKFVTQAGQVDVRTIPWKQGYSCQDTTCPSAALSPSCVGSASQSSSSVTIKYN